MNQNWTMFLRALDAGASLHDAALRAGVPVDEAERLAMTRHVLRYQQGEATKRRKVWLAASLTVGVAVATALTASPAFAQSCTQTLPSPLITFCPDSPAQAANVNDNTQQLITWLQQKVGTVGSANVTTTGSITSGSLTTGAISAANLTSSGSGTFTGALTAGGTLSAARGSFSAGTIQRGGAAITATSDLGLYSRVATNFIRIVTNNAPIRFYTQEGADGIGATAAFSVETDGTLTGATGEPEGTAWLPPNFCVIVPRNTTCPGNWDAREVKWDTEDDSNADQGKDGRSSWDDGNSASVRMRFCCRAW